MTEINLNNGHTPLSPGGVFGGRTEYSECKKLTALLYKALKSLDPSLSVRLTEGITGIKENNGGLLFVFHKGTHIKNEAGSGAGIFVGAEADTETQYDAYRILMSLCSEGGFRYRGVHTLTEKSPFRAFSEYAPESAYIIKAGFIDNEEDNMISDRELLRMVQGLSETIVKIYKERINEDNG